MLRRRWLHDVGCGCADGAQARKGGHLGYKSGAGTFYPLRLFLLLLLCCSSNMLCHEVCCYWICSHLGFFPGVSKLCDAVSFQAASCREVLCLSMFYSASLCYAVLWHSMLCCAVLCHALTWCARLVCSIHVGKLTWLIGDAHFSESGSRHRQRENPVRRRQCAGSLLLMCYCIAVPLSRRVPSLACIVPNCYTV